MEQSTYALIMGRDADGTRTMLTLNVEGERTLAVFESAEAAEGFVEDGNLAPAWWVAYDPDGCIADLLREVVAPRIRYVAVNPPVAVKGSPPRILLIPIERFVEDW
jgi:hypothetical protein